MRTVSRLRLAVNTFAADCKTCVTIPKRTPRGNCSKRIRPLHGQQADVYKSDSSLEQLAQREFERGDAMFQVRCRVPACRRESRGLIQRVERGGFLGVHFFRLDYHVSPFQLSHYANVYREFRE